MSIFCQQCGAVIALDKEKEHDCVAVLRDKLQRLTTAYQELKEQALDAGLTVRSINF